MVHPFVEVSFQKSSARTTAGNGTSPTWNQELCLPVKYLKKKITLLKLVNSNQTKRI
jgi:Ca2+-dependent lipid-binding protein